MIKRAIKFLLTPSFGKKQYYNIFEKLFRLSLTGMNIGGGADTNDSGEIYVLNYLKERFKNNTNSVLFDVGANIGDYSLLLRNIIGENSDIYSFEPSKKTFNKLASNIERNKKIYLYNLGFGKENEKKILYTNCDESGLASVYKRKLDHLNINMTETEEIDIKTVDSFCEENNIKHIDLLKMDVEGNEFNVLEGAKKMLISPSIDFIQFEFGGCNIDSRTYFQDFYYLLKDNYKIFKILKNGLQEINEYSESCEIFVTTNYLAERK